MRKYMEVLNKLVKINLKKNKQRTIVSIIGIILSCALITTLMTLVNSAMASFVNQSLIDDGNRHLVIYDVEKDDVEDITLHKEVEQYYLTNNKTARIKEITKQYWNAGLIGMDNTAILELERLLLEGSIPKNENEIVIDYFCADENKITIGDTITLDIGNRISEGYILNDSNPLNEDEIFEIDETKEYTVVGISKWYTYLKTNYTYNFYTLDTNIENNANIHITLTNPKDYMEITRELINGEIDEYGYIMSNYSYQFNNDFFRWSGYNISDRTQNFVYSMSLILAFIIVFTSVFCIRNTFAISVSEKTKLYGMLSSIGATQKQIKQTVLKEGVYLGIIGIPSGIIIGLLTGFILIEFINNFIIYLNSSSIFIFKISWFSVVVAIFLSSLTIYLSAIKSAKKASKITEIEAIKNQKDIKLSSKKLNTPKYIKSIFKTGGVLAYKNMKRNKSKYRATLISLIVSITSFIAISYFVELGFVVSKENLENYSYDILFLLNNPMDERSSIIHNDIVNLEYVESYVTYKSIFLFVDTKYAGFDPNDMAFNDYIFLEVITVNDEAYLEYIQNLGFEYEEVYDKAFIISNEITRLSADGSILQEIHLIDEKHKTIEIYSDEFTMELDLISGNKSLMGMERYDISSSFSVVLVSNELYEKIENVIPTEFTFLTSNNIRELQSLINDYKLENNIELELTNISEAMEMQKNVILFVSVFLYGFIGVITLIGITNIFNTITTNMMLRQREFAILKSTGMTKSEFNNMIRLESVFYGSKALIFGITFGLTLAYLMYRVLDKSQIMSVFEFNIPYKSILVAIIFVFLIVTIIMKYSMSKVNKQNIIETIKNENI